jgi:hypothetical protein
MSEEELEKVDVNQLVSLIKSLTGYKHKIFYFGSNSPAVALEVINKLHTVNATLKDHDKEERGSVGIANTESSMPSNLRIGSAVERYGNNFPASSGAKGVTHLIGKTLIAKP